MTHHLEIANTSNWSDDDFLIRFKHYRDGETEEHRIAPGGTMGLPTNLDVIDSLEIEAVTNEELGADREYRVLNGHVIRGFSLPVETRLEYLEFHCARLEAQVTALREGAVSGGVISNAATPASSLHSPNEPSPALYVFALSARARLHRYWARKAA